MIISREVRNKLEKMRFFKENDDFLFAGWDCEGEELRKGDSVEVVIEEKNGRCQQPEYDYCSKGKRGTIVRHFSGWIVSVQFLEKKIGCADINLKKV